MRPTGRLHLGHLVGALENWVKLQDTYECFFMIADWHALTDRTDTLGLEESVEDILLDWLTVGLTPEKSTLFLQSHIPEHAELHLLLSMITPLGWLERCPTFKERLAEGRERNYGLLGYPVLQAADILVYKADTVPVGEDQIPHLELTREIARRFNKLYRRVFPEPQPLLSRTTKLLGLDGRKMSKSYENYISLSEDPKRLKKKVMGMFTDPEKIYRGDPGHPERCNVYSYHKAFGEPQKEVIEKIARECREGSLGCTICKGLLVEVLSKLLKPFWEKRKELEKDKKKLRDILAEGRKKAREIASSTLEEVREAMKMNYGTRS